MVDNVSFIKTFIMTHSMALAIFNEFSTLKLLSIGETRFASTVVMLKRIKLLKTALQRMVISDQWSTYREDNQQRAAHVKELLLNDVWWDKIDYILSFTNPIYDMLRICDTDASTLSSCSGPLASFDSIEGRYILDAKSWWVTHGSSTPCIQKIALKLLVQPCSSSCCERNWSTYSFIHSLKRNKMDPKRAEDLVYVHTNL